MPLPDTAVRPIVLFDLDGTLIDSLELLVSAMRHAFAASTVATPPAEEWVAYIGRTLAWQFAQFVPEHEIPALIQRYREFQSAHHDELTRVFDGIPELVARLDADGHPLGVVTSKIDVLATRSLEHVGLAAPMDVVVGASRTARHKPEPDPVLLALELLGGDPHEAVYIGDSPFDIMSGNAAGVTTVGVTWGASSHQMLLEATPTHVVTSLAELEALIAELRRAYDT